MIGELLLCTALTAVNIQEVCKPDVPFIWCEYKQDLKSDTKPYQCKGGKGVSMHLYHHGTGCNGGSVSSQNFFRGSKSENIMEWNRLEKIAIPNAVNCSVIDATGFSITEDNCHNEADKDLCKGGAPLCGLGTISFYRGTKSITKSSAKLNNSCKITSYIGSYIISRDNKGNVMTYITSDVGMVTYKNHIKQDLKKTRKSVKKKVPLVATDFTNDEF